MTLRSRHIGSGREIGEARNLGAQCDNKLYLRYRQNPDNRHSAEMYISPNKDEEIHQKLFENDKEKYPKTSTCVGIIKEFNDYKARLKLISPQFLNTKYTILFPLNLINHIKMSHWKDIQNIYKGRYSRCSLMKEIAEALFVSLNKNIEMKVPYELKWRLALSILNTPDIKAIIFPWIMIAHKSLTTLKFSSMPIRAYLNPKVCQGEWSQKISLPRKVLRKGFKTRKENFMMCSFMNFKYRVIKYFRGKLLSRQQNKQLPKVPRAPLARTQIPESSGLISKRGKSGFS